MGRRRQFQGISHDVLETFLSRYNDLGGYWALGQYRSFLEWIEQRQIEFRLANGVTLPENESFEFATKFYNDAILRMMRSNAMPHGWLADAFITLAIIDQAKIHCDLTIVSDLGKIYRSKRTLTVRPHNPIVEYRRADRFGPSSRQWF